MSETFNFGTGSFDLWFTMPALSTGQWVRVICDSAVTAGDVGDADASATIQIERTATGYDLSMLSKSGSRVDKISIAAPAGACRVRVNCRNNAFSIILGRWWGHTFIVRTVSHRERPAVYLSASAALTVTDILLVELSDGHDEVSIDIENTTANAISSVINGRPISTWSVFDGSICYAYDVPAQEIKVQRVATYNRRRALTPYAAADLVVFHQNTAVLSDAESLATWGFLTRVFRYPDLEAGAIRAGRKIQELSKSGAVRGECRARIDPRLEMFDTVQVEMIASGGVAGVEDSMLVDVLSILSMAAMMRFEGNAG